MPDDVPDDTADTIWTPRPSPEALFAQLYNRLRDHPPQSLEGYVEAVMEIHDLPETLGGAFPKTPEAFERRRVSVQDSCEQLAKGFDQLAKSSEGWTRETPSRDVLRVALAAFWGLMKGMAPLEQAPVTERPKRGRGRRRSTSPVGEA